MTDRDLEMKLGALVREERKITCEILALINLASKRQLHLKRGYGSLFDWLTKAFGYSESAAQRRIQAARLLRAVPEAKDKLESGAVNMTNLAKAQTALRAQEKAKGAVSTERKRDLVTQLEGKSSQEAERLLVALFPESAIKRETKTPIDAETTRVGVNLPNETLADLIKIRDLLSHKFPGGGIGEVISFLAKEFRQRKDPTVKQRVGKRAGIIQRDQGRCTYKDPQTGKVCGSTYQVQIDHRVPRALGGSDDPENLRCLCRKHNLLMAEKILGADVAHRWRGEKSGQ